MSSISSISGINHPSVIAPNSTDTAPPAPETPNPSKVAIITNISKQGRIMSLNPTVHKKAAIDNMSVAGYNSQGKPID